MAEKEHWTVVVDGQIRTFQTNKAARDYARTLAESNPGKTVYVYKLLKTFLAPASAVVEEDPTP